MPPRDAAELENRADAAEDNELGGVRWLSGRALDSGARGRGFETYLRRVVSLSKALYSRKVLVIPRKWWLRTNMTENC